MLWVVGQRRLPMCFCVVGDFIWGLIKENHAPRRPACVPLWRLRWLDSRAGKTLCLRSLATSQARKAYAPRESYSSKAAALACAPPCDPRARCQKNATSPPHPLPPASYILLESSRTPPPLCPRRLACILREKSLATLPLGRVPRDDNLCPRLRACALLEKCPASAARTTSHSRKTHVLPPCTRLAQKLTSPPAGARLAREKPYVPTARRASWGGRPYD
jgi:hypothetical protein